MPAYDPPIPSIFVSYAHESEDFCTKVGGLVKMLRDNGCDVFSDHSYAYPRRAPENGWITWMRNGINQSSVVLVVCSPAYYQRYTQSSSELFGNGVKFEGAIIVQQLYDAGMLNRKFVPILPDSGEIGHIPDELRAHYNGHRFPSKQGDILQMINGSFPISNQQAEHSEYKKLTNDTGNLEAPPSFEIDWATRIGLLRPLLVEALSHPTIQRSRTFRIVQPLELPARLYDVLIIFDNTIGQRAVEIFMTLTRELSGEIHRQPESWTKTELAQMNENLRQAMGCLARLCIHPAADYCSFGRFDGYLELGVDTPAAATMTLRERPELSWVAQVDPHDGQPELSDPHIYEMLESGESESARNEMVRGLAANLSPTGLAPDRVDDKLIKRLRARAISEAAEGRSRYIVGSQVSVETSKWVWSQLKVGVVKPTGDDGSIYLYEEAVLMMRLHQFLEYFKQSEWKSE